MPDKQNPPQCIQQYMRPVPAPSDLSHSASAMRHFGLTLLLVNEIGHQTADPSCLAAKDQDLRHGGWFSRRGHG